MAQQKASSSLINGWTYDVFLSFRGEDTRTSFTGSLYNSLRQRGIRTFLDDEGIRRGEELTPSLFKAIEKSRIAIIIFSENYASSTFCLDELVNILERMKTKGRLVWPVFYKIDPSQVRHQRGSYGEALAMHERKFQDVSQKVKKWRLALRTAADLSGWHFKPGHEYEHAFIRKIIHEVSQRVGRIPLNVASHPVGLEPRVDTINTLLAMGFDHGVNMVGIYGIGGIGKSTLARAVYNSIADEFDGLCFLADIREKSIMKHGIVQLQEIMLFEIFGEKDIKLEYVHKGIQVLKDRLQQNKILLILDDVDQLEQLNALAGGVDWFGSGSRIIITTRDEQLLNVHGVERKYEVKQLNHGEAHEMFMWNAFRTSKVDQCYMDISNRLVLCAGGLPLALEVMGSNLFGKNLYEWNSALSKYERNSDKKVQEVLKVSYDGLEEDQKKIFLDIACFFKGERLEYVNKMLLYFRDCQPDYAIGVLNAKSLIHTKSGKLAMHDLIQDMGREIVKQESLAEPGGRSRLWFYDDILHVLQDNTGTDKIEVIMLEFPTTEKVHWNGKAFKKMKNLRVLIIRNAHFSTDCKHLPNSLRVLDWKEYPSSALPSEFYPSKLIILNLPDSSLEMLDSPQNLKHLSMMDFRYCKYLRQVSDLSGAPNLTSLYLDECMNLTEIHDSVGFLDKLQVFSAMSCLNLKNLPRAIKWTSLKELNVSKCSHLQSFPEVLEKMKCLRDLNLSETAIEELPFSIQNLIWLQKLDVSKCTRLRQLPTSILELHVLDEIRATSSRGFEFLNKCEVLEQGQEGATSMVSPKWISLLLDNCFFTSESLQKCLSSLYNVFQLDLGGCSFTTLPECLKECRSLYSLILDNCTQLQDIKGFPQSIKELSARNCTALSSHCSSMLLSQPTHEAGKTNFIVPGTRIPEWFDHCSRGDTFSFWFRKQFPSITLLVVVGDFLELPLMLNVCMNGTQSRHYIPFYITSRLETEHTIMFDFDAHTIPSSDFRSQIRRSNLLTERNQAQICRSNILTGNIEIRFFASYLLFEQNQAQIDRSDLLPEWNQAQIRRSNLLTDRNQAQTHRFNLLPEWNQAQILCFPSSLKGMHKPEVKWLGVHVLRKSTSTEDVRFTNPNMKGEYCQLYAGGHDSNPNSYSGFKKQSR